MAAEKILNRKSGGLASHCRLGALCALAVQNSAESERGVYLGRAGMDRSPGAPRGSLGSSYEYHLPDIDMKVS
jgi:hypothetical protein